MEAHWVLRNRVPRGMDNAQDNVVVVAIWDTAAMSMSNGYSLVFYMDLVRIPALIFTCNHKPGLVRLCN